MSAPYQARRLAVCALFVAAMALVVVAVALAAPTGSLQVSPAPHETGASVTFTAQVTPQGAETVTGLIWNFGDETGDLVVGPADLVQSHTFAAADEYTVTVTVLDDLPELDTVLPITITVTDPVPPNAAPTASFGYSPADPLAGEIVSFDSDASDPEELTSALAHSWDFGDGGGSSAQDPNHTFKAAGAYSVSLTVTDSGGLFDSYSEVVNVRERPAKGDGGGSGGGNDTPGGGSGGGGGGGGSGGGGGGGGSASPLKLLTPFPIVRLSGVLVDPGADITRLTVRAPKGAVVVVRCKGRGCPVKRLKGVIRKGPKRFKRLEQKLRVGTILEVMIGRPDRIGKFTRFEIRDSRAPKRTDRCLLPGASKGSVCPPSA